MRKLLLFFLFVRLTGVASAHVDVVESVPSPGTALLQSPAEVSVSFTGALSVDSTIRLFTDDFRSFEVGTSVVDPQDATRLTVTVPQPLPPGIYTVQWDIVAADGHRLSGSYQFAVREDTTLRTLALAAAVLLGVGGFAFVIRRRISG